MIFVSNVKKINYNKCIYLSRFFNKNINRLMTCNINNCKSKIHNENDLITQDNNNYNYYDLILETYNVDDFLIGEYKFIK